MIPPLPATAMLAASRLETTVHHQHWFDGDRWLRVTVGTQSPSLGALDHDRVAEAYQPELLSPTVDASQPLASATANHHRPGPPLPMTPPARPTAMLPLPPLASLTARLPSGAGVVELAACAVDADIPRRDRGGKLNKTNGVAAVIAGVDVADCNRAAVGLRQHRHATETGGSVASVAGEPAGASDGNLPLPPLHMARSHNPTIGAEVRESVWFETGSAIDRHVARPVAARRGVSGL